MNSKSMIALAAAGVAALATLTSTAEAGRFGFGYRGPDLYRTPDAHYNSMGMYDTESFLASLRNKRGKRSLEGADAAAKSKPSTTKTIVKRKPQIEPAPVATAKSKVKDPVEATGSLQTARTKPAEEVSAAKPVQASEDVSSVKTPVVKSSANVDKPGVAGAAAATTGKKLDCKVFVPTASMTISVPCND